MSDSSKPRNETYTGDYSRVLCPYCNESNDLSESIGSRGEDVCEWDCGDCGKTFNVRVHISISVTAEERNGGEN
jgi:transposase-like protein